MIATSGGLSLHSGSWTTDESRAAYTFFKGKTG